MPVLIALAIIILLIVIGVNVIGFTLSLLWYLLAGLVVGALARLVVPGRQGIGWLATALFGVAGSLLGGMVASAVGAGTVVALLLSIVVAAVLIALFAGWGGSRSRAV